ncbi:MAG TPA: proton-conducting transporter membrane subunit, partial [Thermodesulfobacteriota bacterium]
TWKPDAYSEAPVPTATLLAAGLLNCALYGLLRFHALAAVAVGAPFVSRLLLIFGLASMALAALFVVGQRNLRRLLAYSSIDHAGIIVAAVGIGGPLASLGAMLHMTFHAVTKPVLFFAVGAIQQRFGTASLGAIRGGLLRTMPATSLFLLGAALAVTASPPFAIFQSEYTILSGAVAAGRTWAAALFLACTVTVFAGFLQKLTHLLLAPADEPGERREADRFSLGAMAVAGALAFGLGFSLPWPVGDLIRQSAAIVGGPW